jgi:hypothetical protein
VSPPWWTAHFTFAELWHVKPWELGEAPAVWIIRAIEYYTLREKLRKKHG